MIKFKQKIFFLPLLLNGALAGSSIMSYEEQKKSDEQNEENAERQADLLKEQNRRLEKISEKVRDNPNMAKDIQGIMQPNGAPQTVKEKFYGAAAILNPRTLRNIRLMASDAGKIIMNHKDKIAGMAVTGAAMGAATYGANKYIQHDMKENRIEGLMMGQAQQQAQQRAQEQQMQQRGYSVLTGISKVGNYAGKIINKNKKSAALWGLGFGAVPMVMSYKADKKAALDQIEENQPQPQYPQQRQYASIGGILTGIKGGLGNMKAGFKTLKSHPVQSILGGMSNFTMGGGKEGVKSVAGEFLHGKSKYTRAIGRAMTTVDKNGVVQPSKWALAASIPVGLGVMKAGWGLPQKAVESTTRAVDPDAYKYQDAKNQQVQQ